MKYRFFISLLLILGFSGDFSGKAEISAAPAPDKVVVNYETRQCALIFGGDECMDCFPPEGWEVLGYYPDVMCPEDYEEVNDLEIECRHFRNDHCCTEGHSGASGNCADLVVNSREKLCAFVENAAEADLPSGWKAKPENTPLQEWLCPYALENWVSEIPIDETRPLDEETQPSILEKLPDIPVIAFLILGLCSCMFLVVLILLAFYLFRKKKS